MPLKQAALGSRETRLADRPRMNPDSFCTKTTCGEDRISMSVPLFRRSFGFRHSRRVNCPCCLRDCALHRHLLFGPVCRPSGFPVGYHAGADRQAISQTCSGAQLYSAAGQTTSSPFINWNRSDDELKAQLEKLNAELAKDDQTEKTIILLHFERNFQNGEVNRQKLDLLEGLVMEGRHNGPCLFGGRSFALPHFGTNTKAGRKYSTVKSGGRSSFRAEPMGKPFSLLCAGT